MQIGKFSRMTGLTLRALRLYDRLGILQPEVTSFETSYRYYTNAQLDTAHFIARLRRVDMPLKDIAQLMITTDAMIAVRLLDAHRSALILRASQVGAMAEEVPSVDDHVNTFREDSDVEEDSEHQCSFCGKAAHDVCRMIAGPDGVVICNECVTRCNEIMEDEEARSAGRAG
jgi:DNA-binding transcriptional MerR regulator